MRFEEAGGDGDGVDGSGALVFFPGGAGDVAADDGFEGEDGEAADLHGAVVEEGVLGFRNGRGEVEGQEVGFEVREERGEEREPVGGEEGEELAFGGDSLGFR